MQVCRGRHSSPAALASAAHTLLFLLYKIPDRTLADFAAGRVFTLQFDFVVFAALHAAMMLNLAFCNTYSSQSQRVRTIVWN